MKNNLFLLIYILPLLIFSQNTDYSGKWTDSSPASTVSSIKIIPGEKFENTLTLEKIKDEENSYKFTFFGWRDSYNENWDILEQAGIKPVDIANLKRNMHEAVIYLGIMALSTLFKIAGEEDPDDPDENSRSKLYSRLVKRYASKMGFKVEEIDIDVMVLYVLKRK